MIHFLLAFFLLTGSAHADSGMLLVGVANRQMPLDAVAAPTRAYSDRRLRTAYTANKAYGIVRASDSTTLDIGFTPSGMPDTAAETTFCAATTCKRTTWYDQSGNTINITQGTDANRPQSQPACLGLYSCLRTTAGGNTIVSAANFTPATGVATLAVVANRSAGSGACALLRQNAGNNRLLTRGAAAGLNITGGTSGSITNSAADAAWHATIAVINGAGSVLNTDGAETTGAVTGNTTAGLTGIVGVAATTCDQVSAIFWDNIVLTAAERAYIVNNARAFWRF